MSEVPTRDVALCVELGTRPIYALMTRGDFLQQVRRALGEAVRSQTSNNEGGET